MCYFVYAATPLTLSELRSMLPLGLTADGLGPDELPAFRHYHRDAQTAARLLYGACSCALVIERDPDGKGDEAHLRARARKLGLPRDAVLQMLERHRRARPLRHHSLGDWQRALVAFVAEHARNAGPTLYYRHFAAGGLRDALPPAEESVTVALDRVRAAPAEWLADDRPTLVVR
jgi:hypothetical protein